MQQRKKVIMNHVQRTPPAAVPADSQQPACEQSKKRVRHPSLTDEQVEHLRSVAAVYIPDLRDPAAAEVLLVLLEVCRILRLSPERVARVFGERALTALEAWGM
jgi:hypothetical protein